MLFILLQLFSLLAGVSICSYISRGELFAYDPVFIVVLVFFIIGFSFLTELNKPKLYQKKYKYVFAPYLKCVFLFFLFSCLFNWLFNKNEYEHYQNLFLVAITSVLFIITNSVLIAFLLYFRKNDEWIEEINKYTQDVLKLDSTLKLGKFGFQELKKVRNLPSSVLSRIDETLNSDCSSLVEIITKHNEIKTTLELPDIIVFDSQLNFLLNINDHFKSSYKRLKNGGLFIIFYEDIEDYERRFLNSNSSVVKLVKTIHYYLFRRALPKLPMIRFVFNLFSNRYNVISKAEIWGRLVYSGFDVIHNFNGLGFRVIVAKKTYQQSPNPNPSFYHFITLNRVSLFGKVIRIHKLRSMYPYSEFIQEKVFEGGRLNSIGKFENDFRITKPGRLFRKYWVDELPQFYDWLRGEIKLVGIRAMSQHFFSLYPEDYKEIYLKIKPGIICPIFDEKTTGFDDIVRIEREYMNSYLNCPFKTDLKYLFRTISRIISGVRSK